MTAWVLVFLMAYDRSMPTVVIQDMESLAECRRVAEVLQDSEVLNIGKNKKAYQCIEIRKAK